MQVIITLGMKTLDQVNAVVQVAMMCYLWSVIFILAVSSPKFIPIKITNKLLRHQHSRIMLQLVHLMIIISHLRVCIALVVKHLLTELDQVRKSHKGIILIGHLGLLWECFRMTSIWILLMTTHIKYLILKNLSMTLMPKKDFKSNKWINKS